MTGGGGSIGSEICTRVVAFGASDLLILESSEPSLHHILENPTLLSSDTNVDGVIADVRDRERVEVMKRFGRTWSSTPRPSSTCPISRRTGPRHQDQRLRLGERGRRGGGGRRRHHRDDLHRQGHRSGLDAGSHQAPCRDVRAGARCRIHGPQRRHPHHRRALRQRAGLGRLRGAEVQGADRPRRADHRHPSRHGALLHDHPRGGGPGAHLRLPCGGEPRRDGADQRRHAPRSMC